MNTQAVIKIHTNLTPTSQPEPITQETQQSPSQVEDLNNLKEIIIKKHPIKGKHQQLPDKLRTKIRKIRKWTMNLSSTPQPK